MKVLTSKYFHGIALTYIPHIRMGVFRRLLVLNGIRRIFHQNQASVIIKLFRISLDR